MELCGHGYLEGLFLAHQKRNPPWEANVAPMEMNELFSSDWNYDFFEDYQIPITSSHFPNYCSSQEPLLSPPTQHPDQNIFTELHQYPLSIESLAHQLLDSPISPPRITSSSYSPCDDDAPLFPVQEMTLPLSMMVEEGEATFPHADDFNQALGMRGDCKPESMESPKNQVPVHFEAGPGVGAKNNLASKKLEGQPSKNLMAERRRRKRLNDRLSMLRSIIPKISKMDRISILGDTIDYMKELLQKINYLQYHSFGPYHLNIMDIIKDMKPNQMPVRNTQKFDVERRDVETRIEICCAAKPGLLLSTVSKLESLGLDIQECVISCFNDFAMQASCSEEMQQRDLISTGDIKQALLRNTGYGGRCL